MSQKRTEPENTRRQLLKGGAAAAAVATGGTLGFSRLASAQFDPATAVTQTAAFAIDPEREEEALELLRTLTAAVEANEPGVLAYIAHRSQQEPNRIVFFEVYADAEAVAAHGQAPHLAPLRQAFGAGVFKGPLELTKLDRLSGFWR
jgi:quinol monooxygenase YgiN